MASILLPSEKTSKNSFAWSSRLQNENVIAAPVHEMVMPLRPVPRMEELSYDEEVSCWGLVKQRTGVILQDPAVKAVGILLNDGFSAGQTVGHAHIHVLGLVDPALIADLGVRFDNLTEIYTESTAARPIATRNFEAYSENITAYLREERERTSRYFDDVGFSIFTNRQVVAPNQLHSMTVQSWSEQSMRPYGLTNLIRVLNGYRDRPYDWPVAHREDVFEPEN